VEADRQAKLNSRQKHRVHGMFLPRKVTD